MHVISMVKTFLCVNRLAPAYEDVQAVGWGWSLLAVGRLPLWV